MVNVPKGYRSRNVNDRRGSGRRGGGADLLGGMLGGGASSGGGLLGSLGRAALPMILGSLMRGRGRSGGGLGGLLGSMLGGGGKDQRDEMSDDQLDELDDDATLLLRAMINAAKSDGKIDKEEVENIVGRLGDIDANEKAFLDAEFSAPLDVAAFCNSVPEELNEEVYAFSVMGLRLDTQQEAQYLGAVAQGLQLDPNTCNAIHKKLGVPEIFS